ncbi:hypothetical protein ACFE04_018370 [Oxalis oulophora]
MKESRNPRSVTPIKDDGLRSVPQLFDSVPSMNEAASYLAESTSIFTSCFADTSVDPASSGYSTLPTDDFSPVGHPGTLFESPRYTTAPDRARFMTNPSTCNVSEDDKAIIQSNSTGPNSIFKGLIEKVQRTVRGSADDIGWLQRAPGMPSVKDGTERFLEILDNIRHGLHYLPNTMIYMLVPGLFSNHGPLYFINTKTYFSKMGLVCHIAKIHSEAAVEKNAREIKECIEEIYWGSKKQVLILGHSKGGIDAAAALSLYWPQLKDKVAGLVLAQSPYGGSPIASDLLREGQLGDYVNMRKILEILICKVIKGDIRALEDLTYEKRKDFLSEHQLPTELPIISFHTEASVSPAVLATLSRVAHAELPLVAPLSSEPATKLPVVMPLGAAMAASAQLLQMRYGEKSDGLVTCRDAEVPGSIVVRPTRKFDHAWMVYSALNDDPMEADASQVCEALLTLLVEVGQKKKMHDLAQKDD